MRLSIATILAFTGISCALTHAVDSSSHVSTVIYKKALSEGFTRAIFRGYQEACGSGGRVDPNFVPSYKNAQAAGYKNFDAYFFPCSGKDNKCKPYSTQIHELVDTIEKNKLAIRRIWIDIETDRICNPWNYGSQGNIAEAKKIIQAVRDTKKDFGIYTSASKWVNIFGSKNVVLANDVPLWFAKFDNVETLDLVSPFGGWTKADAKQYTDKSGSGQFDLNVFSA
ncbi:hypothetical protein VHEMI00258 [[Torrubiella] hemipterigena]|uniref:Glycoside hydrolase family 25 protein n=1 Tax=[Torrubiella] hemipterigena TaxID=1531966 RepID=A0A0A1SIU0_9HYPO|nr:hypothetical protein VHEMI00258 [[Torrubiella] hemipterigena]